MKLTAIGDIGLLDGMLHTGDEAMFDELVTRMRERGATRIVAISANPAESAERYGVDAVARIGGWVSPAADSPTADREAAVAANTERQRAVVALAHPGTDDVLDPDDPARAVIAAIAAGDGVVIAGGGNMASTWPLHIWERGTIGLIARALGRPLVVTGQTIGPALTPGDGERIRDLLSGAAFVGLREPASVALCTRLGVPAELLVETIDDASFLGIEAEPHPAATDSADAGPADADPAERVALVSLSGHLGGADRDAVIARLAELLDGLARTHGLLVRFLPHFAPTRQYLPDGSPDVRGDVRLHEAVRAAMASPSEALPVGDARTAAHLARSAAVVVTSRYHPAVFAASAGTPIVAISVDDYTAIKLAGATARLGQTATVLTIAELVAGSAPAHAEAVLAAAPRIRSTGLSLAAARRADAAAWWDRVAAAVTP